MKKSLPVLVMIAVLLSGVASVASPSSDTTTADLDNEKKASPTPKGSPTPKPSKTHGVDDNEADEVETENQGVLDGHSAAVHVAAHCPVKGRAHGTLVSSIARNKAATITDATAACAAAVAAQSAAQAQGPNSHSNGHAKTGPGKPTTAGAQNSSHSDGHAKNDGHAQNEGKGKSDGKGNH